MYTLKLDWSSERIEAVTEALRAYLENPGGLSSLDPEIEGALTDMALYQETTEQVITQIRRQHPGALLTGDQVRIISGIFSGNTGRIEHIRDDGYDVSVTITTGKRKDQLRRADDPR